MSRSQAQATTSAVGGTASHVGQDPLYDGAYVVFVYAAWVASSWAFGALPGLVILAAGTMFLAMTGGRSGGSDQPRSFASELAVLMLFCSATIATGVFYLEALKHDALLTLWLTATAVTIVAFAASSNPEPK